MDRLTKYRHFVPYKESSTAEDLAYTFIRTVVSQHGLLEEIILDKDKLFTSKFQKSLMAQLGANYKLSTAFHPQTDRQTERLNQTLKQYLQSYVNQEQDNQVQLLPLAQFAYNSLKSKAISILPFFTNYRYNLEAYCYLRKDNTRAERAILVVDKLKGLYSKIAIDIEFQNQQAAIYANKKQSIRPLLEKEDKVYLLRKNIRTKQLNTKLDFKKLGLFGILDKVRKVNYQL